MQLLLNERNKTNESKLLVIELAVGVFQCERTPCTQKNEMILYESPKLGTKYPLQGSPDSNNFSSSRVAPQLPKRGSTDPSLN